MLICCVPINYQLPVTVDMKIYVVLLFAIYGALAKKPTLPEVLHSWKSAIAPHITECLCKSGANQEHLQLFFKHGIISDDPCFKCMQRCVAFKLKTMTQRGEVDAQRIVDLLPHTNLQLVKKCVDHLNELDLCQKTYLGMTCILKEVAKQCN